MEASEPQAGDWCVISNTSDWHPRVPTFAAGQITRVTPKLVYANAHYRSQHPRENVTVMTEEAARWFVEKSKSYHAESTRREKAAWQAYNDAIGKMFAALHPKETPHGE